MNNFNLLDCEETLEDKLCFVEKSEEEKFFDELVDEKIKSKMKIKTLKAKHGFCFKFPARRNGIVEKIYINICHHKDVPAPDEMDISELYPLLINRCDEFRLPISLSDLRSCEDKGTGPHQICDVWINSKFYLKVGEDELVRHFIISLAFEAVQAKFDLECRRDDCTILKKRKFVGNIPPLMIPENPVVHDAPIKPQNTKKPLIQVLDSQDSLTPLSRMVKIALDETKFQYILEVFLKDIEEKNQIDVKVSESAISVKTTEPYSYFLEYYLEETVEEELVTCKFNCNTMMLTVFLPIRA